MPQGQEGWLAPALPFGLRTIADQPWTAIGLFCFSKAGGGKPPFLALRFLLARR